MRFIINKDFLLKGMNIVSKAIPSKSNNPVFYNVKFDMNMKGLELTASDGEFSIKTLIPYMIGEKTIIRNAVNGVSLVACRMALEIVRKLDSEEVSFDIIDNSILKIEDERSSFKLVVEDYLRYPNIEFTSHGTPLTLTSKDIQTLVDSTSFAASTKEARPILTAIHLESKDGEIYSIATDSARLARKKLPIASSSQLSANIPSKKMLEIVRLLEGTSFVECMFSDNKAIFSFDNTTISTRLIDAAYPNTANIFPKVFNYHLEINSKEFLNALDRVSLLSSDRDGVVKLVATEDEVVLSSKSSLNEIATEKISVFRFMGERLEINFKASFVVEAIKAQRCEDVIISFVGDMKPFIVKNPKDNTLDMVITPLRS